MPETRQQAVRRAVKGNTMVYGGIAIGVLVLVINIILSAYATNLNEQIASLDGQLRTQEQSRDRDEERRLQAIQKQSRLMGQLLSNHLYWSRAFETIEGLMQSGVTMQSIAADVSDGTVQFGAAAGSYGVIAQQLASFLAGQGVKDVLLTGASADPSSGIEFDGEIIIDTTAVLKITPTPRPSAQPTP
ncbi:MAG TPA: hypothetical protein VD862_02180 [Candidatus Paceibacterota bacterium]|nr:hypothetical protein [Candidatus Paceibacterota bacterium]